MSVISQETLKKIKNDYEQNPVYHCDIPMKIYLYLHGNVKQENLFKRLTCSLCNKKTDIRVNF